MEDIRESVAELAYYRAAIFDPRPMRRHRGPTPRAERDPMTRRTTPARTRPRMSIAEANAHADRAGADLRDGGARHPRRPDPHLEERARRRCAPCSTCRPRTATPTSSSTRTSARPSPSTTGSPARWPHRLRDAFGVEQGDRVAIAMRNLPEWVMAFWAAIAGRRRRRPAQRLVERRGAGLRPGGLGLQGGLRRRRSARSASAPSSAGSTDLRAVIVADEHRTEPTAPPAVREPGPAAAPVPDGPSRSPLGAGRRGRHAPRRRPSTPRTTPPSSTRRAPPAGPRARWAPTATSCTNLMNLFFVNTAARLRFGTTGADRRVAARGARPERHTCCRCRCSTPPGATPSWSPTSPPAGSS